MSSPFAIASSKTSAGAAFFGDSQRVLSQWMRVMQTRAESLHEADSTESFQLPLTLHRNDGPTLTRLCNSVQRVGFALYEWTGNSADTSRNLNQLLQALSLHNSDSGVIHDVAGLSLLQDLSGTPKGRFPPYQPKALKWHTDGYYNTAAEQIRCFTLHCLKPAAEGGALLLMDDALLVWLLLQDDPDLVRLLARPQAMTLPRNQDAVGHDRPDRTVPMLVRHSDGAVSMRFTMRTHNINWYCDATKAAALRAAELIELHPEYHTRVLLKRGQGIITRNILHARESYTDASGYPGRQMLRGRFTQLPTYTAGSGF